MLTLDGFKLQIRNFYLRSTANIRRNKLTNKNFTIISNNCWAGLVYESYNLPKQTPTVGMYFVAEEYLKFISDLKYYTTCEMKFIDPYKSKHRKFYENDSKFGSYPIALLDDVEIALLHYHSKEEAKEKWERRCKRINWDKIIIKMNDQNECTLEQVKRFLDLEYKNKIFFTVKQEWNLLGATVLNSKRKDCCGLFDEPYGASKKINITSFINSLLKY